MGNVQSVILLHLHIVYAFQMLARNASCSCPLSLMSLKAFLIKVLHAALAFCHTLNLSQHPEEKIYQSETRMARDMWAPWAGVHSHQYSLQFYGLGQGWRTLLSVHAQTADNIRRNSFMCGNFCLLAPYFQLFW